MTALHGERRLIYMNTNEYLNPAAVVALQFEQESYEMLRRAGVSEARIDAMRAQAAKTR